MKLKADFTSNEDGTRVAIGRELNLKLTQK